MADSYAIVETGGKQYRAEKGAKLLDERLPADEGSKVNLRAVMFKGDGDVVVDGDKLEKVKVEAVVAGHVRGPKVRIFKYKAKKGYRRRAGHRQALTRLEVTEVRMLTRKPAGGATKQAEKKTEPKTEAKPKAPAKRTAPKRAAPKKPAAKKPAAKKPAARRSAGAGSKSSSGGRSASSRRSASAKKES
jgi:large subunit ribosomal protein L21